MPRAQNILAASTSAFGAYPIDEALKGIEEAGYTHVELACLRGSIEHVRQEQMTEFHARRMRERLARHQLQTLALSAHMDLTAEHAVEDFSARLRFAHTLGARIVNANVSPAAQEARFLANLKAVLPLAQELELTIGLEAPGFLLPSVADYRRYLTTLDAPNVGLNFDIGNVFTASLGQVDPLPLMLELLDHVIHLHLKDAYLQGEVWRFCPLGQGDIDYQRILETLAASGKKIPMSIEMPLTLEGQGTSPAYLLDVTPSCSAIVAGLTSSRAFAERALEYPHNAT